MSFYRHFTLPMDRSHGFGSMAANSSPSSDSLSLRLRSFYSLTLLTTITRWPVLQKVRDQGIKTFFSACKHQVSGSISLPSRGSFHRSLTVLCAIGHQGVFSLRGWSPCVPTKFHVLRGTRSRRAVHRFGYGTVTLFGAPSQKLLLQSSVSCVSLGLYPVRSPLLRVSRFLSFPLGT